MRMDFGLRPIWRPGVAFIGDAAGLVSPINGEGISHAMESGQIVAEQIPDDFSDNAKLDRALVYYEKAMQRRFLSHFRWGRILEKVLGNPDRLNRLISEAQKDEYLRTILGGVFGNILHPCELIRFKSLMKIIF
jgi:flavin-dependent dehydrogenase